MDNNNASKNFAYFLDVRRVMEIDGTLIVIENSPSLPFNMRRIFIITDVVQGKSRGDHATKKTQLILIPVKGSCKVSVDDGKRKEIFNLNDASKGLYIAPMTWRSMFDFSPDCVLISVCDRKFDPIDETYKNYSDFLNALK